MNVAGPLDITFTQYLRPDGRKREVWIERQPDVVAVAKRLQSSGYHFDIEELQTGHVSMTVEPHGPDANGDDAPIAQEICLNGPEVPIAVDKLIMAAAHRVFGTQEHT